MTLLFLGAGALLLCGILAELLGVVMMTAQQATVLQVVAITYLAIFSWLVIVNGYGCCILSKGC